jgi:hypothetical protein
VTDPTETAADALVTEARNAVHESLIRLPAWEADHVRSLIADLETAVESRTAIRCADASAVQAPATDQTAALSAFEAGLHGQSTPKVDSKPATDQTALRKVVAEALHAQLPGCTHDEHGSDCLALADVVLPVLPAPVDQAAALSETERRMLEYALDLADDEIATDGSDFTDEEEDALAELRRIVTKPTTDQAAVRAEAEWIIEHCPDHGCVEPATDVCHCEIADRLRRLADETPAAETEKKG